MTHSSNFTAILIVGIVLSVATLLVVGGVLYHRHQLLSSRCPKRDMKEITSDPSTDTFGRSSFFTTFVFKTQTRNDRTNERTTPRLKVQLNQQNDLEKGN